MISDYLLAQEEAGENVLCVEIDYIGDSQDLLLATPMDMSIFSSQLDRPLFIKV